MNRYWSIVTTIGIFALSACAGNPPLLVINEIEDDPASISESETTSPDIISRRSPRPITDSAGLKTDWLSALSFSSDGKKLYAADGSEPILHVLNLETSEYRIIELKGSYPVSNFTPDRRSGVQYLSSGAAMNRHRVSVYFRSDLVYRLDEETDQLEIMRLADRMVVADAALTRNGSRLVLADLDRPMLWELSTNSLEENFEAIGMKNAPGYQIASTIDGDHLFVAPRLEAYERPVMVSFRPYTQMASFSVGQGSTVDVQTIRLHDTIEGDYADFFVSIDSFGRYLTLSKVDNTLKGGSALREVANTYFDAFEKGWFKSVDSSSAFPPIVQILTDSTNGRIYIFQTGRGGVYVFEVERDGASGQYRLTNTDYFEVPKRIYTAAISADGTMFAFADNESGNISFVRR